MTGAGVVKRLVTERDVRAWIGREPIRVDEETLITPGALDLAHERGIPVVYAGGRASPFAPDVVPGAGSGTSLEEVLGLPSADGTYLVRIEGGKRTIYRVTASGLEPLA
ncbi:MAG TPA: hypothetical protein VKF62_12440 [Planctomycetota bacterium]|nr:hypothetical protein [Planctomycetota bacterium]